ncbi:hypothetical protein GCM10010129_47750 [Streptomyces fumigatiscleroticus]|nr:hypothetical protein GCM10010129_47750 [Streptomyces fumigatiscleroticus]
MPVSLPRHRAMRCAGVAAAITGMPLVPAAPAVAAPASSEGTRPLGTLRAGAGHPHGDSAVFDGITVTLCSDGQMSPPADRGGTDTAAAVADLAAVAVRRRRVSAETGR